MLLLKACPRCRGDLIVEQERYGLLVDCLQCGYLADLQSVRERLAPPMAIRTRPERERAEAA